MNDHESPEIRLLGSLRIEGGMGVVRMEDHFDADIAFVWSALTDPLHLGHWMGEVSGEFGAGGEYRQLVYASGWSGTVRVEEFEPPRHLHLKQTPDGSSVPGTTIDVTLSGDAKQTTLILEARPIPPEYLFAYGAGWQIHVEDLRAHLQGAERCDADVRWPELEPAYQELADRLN